MDFYQGMLLGALLALLGAGGILILIRLAEQRDKQKALQERLRKGSENLKDCKRVLREVRNIIKSQQDVLDKARDFVYSVPNRYGNPTNGDEIIRLIDEIQIATSSASGSGMEDALIAAAEEINQRSAENADNAEHQNQPKI
jgi:hypothetical protein